MSTVEFGKFLMTLRKEKGITQSQLAEKLNVTDKAVSRWETGRNYPDIETFERLAKIFEITVSELLEGRRIEKKQLISVSENQIVEQIKAKNRSSKKYRIIICVVLIITVFIGYVSMKENGVFDGVIYNEIDCYSNDILTILNNVDGYITQRPKSEGEFIIQYGNFFIDADKKSNDLYCNGTCENGRVFYMNTTFDKENPNNNTCFIGEFRKEQKPAAGIPLNDFKKLVSQLDLNSLEAHEGYKITFYDGFSYYDEEDIEPNEYQKNIKKFIYSNNTLKQYNRSTLSGEFLLITITGFDNNDGNAITCGNDIAYIFYEK